MSEATRAVFPRAYVADAAAGYDSDDSSLSSNASGSAKSSDKSEAVSRSSERSSGASDWRGGGGRAGTAHVAARRRPAPYPYQVRYAPEGLLNGSQWDSLSQEIWDKFVTTQQTEETFRKKMNVWRHLYITIKTIFPRYGLYVVGSTMSGFGLEESDMDVCLAVRPAAVWLQARVLALMHLQLVRRCVRDAELIQARVPLLRFSEPGGVRVDLNYNNVVGVRNTALLQAYAAADWRARPLVAVCKLWARAHRINDARRRTLSSYALTLMVLAFLQGTTPPVLPVLPLRGARPPAFRSRNRRSLAELFLQLLQYYAQFPYHELAVSVRAGRPVPVADCRNARAPKNDPHQWKLLCVEEPFELTNTARSVYDPETFARVVNVFRGSCTRLAASLRLGDAWPPPPPPPAP